MAAFISHKFKLIFPHVPRTGGTSLYEVVFPQLGANDITDGQLEKHQSLRLLKIAHPKEFERYTKFAVIRDPFTRLASLHQGYKPPCSLSTIIDELKSGRMREYAFFWPAMKWLCDEYDTLLCDRVFKFEDGFGPVIDFLYNHGVSVNGFPHSNRGEKAQQDGYYQRVMDSLSPETISTIKDLYAWDYRLWDSL